MKARRCQGLVLLCLCLPFLVAGAETGSGAHADRRVNYEPLKETMTAMIRKEMRRNDVIGLSIALVDDQQIVWAQGFGHADKKSDAPATAGTVYRTGTLTGLFTVAAALQAAEKGGLDIDAPLVRYLPEFSIRSRFAGQRSVTLRDLMTHHAGLPANLQKGMWSARPGPYAAVVSLLKDEYTAYPPGYYFSYSTVGITLLGLALERQSGRDYAALAEESLLRPLGMTSSGFSWNGGDSRFSRSYHRGKELAEPVLRDTPAGGMNSTVLDLGRFMAMVFSGGRSADGHQVLRPETVRAMLRPQNEDAPLDLGLSAGLGWMLSGLGEIDIQQAGTVAHHAGATLLSRGQMIILPEHRLGVAVLSNSSSAARTVSLAAAQTLIAALEAKAGIAQPAQKKSSEVGADLSPADRQTYAGWYASLAGLAEIRPRSDHFHAEVMGRTLQLVPHGDGWFGIKYRLLGLFTLSLGELDHYTVSRAAVAGREVLKARTKGREMVIGEKLRQAPVPEAWLKRTGRDVIANRGDDFPLIENIRLRTEGGLLVAECEVPFFFKGTARFALTPVSDTEAVVSGLGRGLGETVRMVLVDGQERIAYSGYLLGLQGDP